MNSTWRTSSNAINISIHLNFNHVLTSNKNNIPNQNFLINNTITNDIISSKITQLILICLVSLMTLVTVSGNLLVIIAFICESRIRTYSNYFILNLSIADLLVGLIW
jgi:hypothetical protein